MTKAEACLWKYALKSKQLHGYQFRRQRPVSKYIADFMCKELMLIIEVDGITHTFEEALEKDTQREKALNELGFTVMRFIDNEILTQIQEVKRILSEWIIANKDKFPPPAPASGG